VTLVAGDLIAVTGGTGAIGRQVVADLLSEGFRVRLLCRSPVAAVEGVECATIDLAKHGCVDAEALRDCKAVVHLASYIPSRQEDPSEAQVCFRTNALGTVKLLEAMERAGVNRLLQTTSANAYAPGIEAPSEQDPMYPDRRAPFYLSSKIAQDIFGSYWSQERGFCVTTLRLSSVYGAGMGHALFTRFAKSLRAKEPIRLANGGSFGADFVELSDVSDAIKLFLQAQKSGAFNIASGRRRTLLEASHLLLELTGISEDQLLVEPVEREEAGFPGMDIGKASECGFVPHDLRWGLRRLVDWVGEER
jgi:UDP-glucose 4-epimerase